MANVPVGLREGQAVEWPTVRLVRASPQTPQGKSHLKRAWPRASPSPSLATVAFAFSNASSRMCDLDHMARENLSPCAWHFRYPLPQGIRRDQRPTAKLGS